MGRRDIPLEEPSNLFTSLALRRSVLSPIAGYKKREYPVLVHLGNWASGTIDRLGKWKAVWGVRIDAPHQRPKEGAPSEPSFQQPPVQWNRLVFEHLF